MCGAAEVWGGFILLVRVWDSQCRWSPESACVAGELAYTEMKPHMVSRFRSSPLVHAVPPLGFGSLGDYVPRGFGAWEWSATSDCFAHQLFL